MGMPYMRLPYIIGIRQALSKCFCIETLTLHNTLRVHATYLALNSVSFLSLTIAPILLDLNSVKIVTWMVELEW